MKASQTISKDIESSHPYGFARLRKEGIEISQDLSGVGWTDYNSHDPGVTILEQVCFALTDLIYRTKFDVADYLCDERGSINGAALGLHPPQDVFFGRPCTPLDYQKSLLDMSHGIVDVKVSSGTAGTHLNGYGLYEIQIRRSPEKSAEAETLEEKTRENFQSIRNLCEDIDSNIEIVEEIDCYLEAEISIKPGYRVANALAEVFYIAATELTRGISYKSYSENLNRGKSLDEVFQGPLTDHGLIDDQQVAHTDDFKNKRLLESGILSASRSIRGIEYIASLRLRPADPDSDCESISDKCKYRLIEPRESSDFEGVYVKSSGHQATFAIDEFRAQLETLKFANNGKPYSLDDDPILSIPPQGIHRNLASYQSLQNQFPEIYGINQFGVPENYSSERKAQALQLKSFLLLFEQIMSNYLANLGSIKQLFSIRGKEKTTYSGGVLSNDEISSLEQVYPENAESILSDILGKIDDFVSRKSRLLDYLLALYGEEFSQNQLRNFNYYHSGEELERTIVLNKIRLLNRIKYASGDRAAAINTHDLESPFVDPSQDNIENAKRLESVSGLQYRVSIFLGFKHLTPHSLTSEIFRHGLSLLPHDKYLNGHEKESVDQARESHEARKESIEQDARYNRIIRETLSAFEPFRNGQLSESVFRCGVQSDAYKYDEQSDELLLSLSDQDAPDGQVRLLTGEGSQAASKQQRFLHRFLAHTNEECEGMHVLEHILLRPGNFMNLGHELKSKYAHRISVVFPSWTARCSDTQFQVFAEALVRDNCPAHIHPEIFWLDFASMCEFEVLFEHWSGLLGSRGRSESSAELDAASRALIRFFELQKSRRNLSTGGEIKGSQLSDDIEEKLSRYVDRLAIRRTELELCARRISDDEQEYLQGIELLQEELKEFKVRSVEHMKLVPKDLDMAEDDWGFHVSNVSVILPQLSSFKISAEQHSHFHEIKTIVEGSIRAFIDPKMKASFHWIVPTDMNEFQYLYEQWERVQKSAVRDSTEWSIAASNLKHVLIKLAAASKSTGDIHQWVPILGGRNG